MRKLVELKGGLRMRNLIITAIFVIAAALGLIAWSTLSGRSSGPVNTPVVREDAVTTQAPPARARASTGKAPAVNSPSIDEGVLAQYRCREGVNDSACDMNLLMGATDEESAWLVQNGYPTLKDVEAVDTQAVNLQQLEGEAAKGDLRSMGLYGRALVNAGEFDAAFEVLSDAVGKGSIFATYELARLYSAKDFKLTNVRESAAYVRAAYLLGDSKAGHRLYAAYPTYGARDFAYIDRRGYDIFKGLIKLRAQGGSPPVSLRP